MALALQYSGLSCAALVPTRCISDLFNGFVYGPSRVQAGARGPRSNAVASHFYSNRNWHSFPLVDHMMVPRTIAALRLACVPCAIVWPVREIAIASFQREFWGWLRTHVGIKFRKVTPSVADANAARAVSVEHFIAWVGASVPHIRPCPMLGAPRLAVSSKSCRRDLSPKASARLRLSSLETFGVGRNFIPAIAPAYPSGLTSHAIRGALYDNQAIEAQSAEVGQFCHARMATHKTARANGRLH